MMTMIRVSVSSVGAISFKLNNLRYDGHKGLNLTLDKKQIPVTSVVLSYSLIVGRVWPSFAIMRLLV